MQLTAQQPDLAQMFGQDSLFSTLYGLQRQDQATAAQNQNLQQAQQDTSFEAQNQPGKLLQQAADLGHTQALTGLTNAQIPGMQADSNTKIRTDSDQAAVPEGMRRQALISKLAAGMTKDDADSHESQARSDLFSPNPLKRQQAQMVLDNMPEIRAKIREVQEHNKGAVAVANIDSSSRERIAQADRDAGKFNKNSTESMLLKMEGGNFQQQAGAANIRMNMALQEAEQADTPQAKQAALAKAEQYRTQADQATARDYAARTAAGNTANAAKPDISSVIGVNPVSDPGAVPRPPQAQPQPTPTPLSGQKVTVFKPDGSPVLIDAAGLNHLPPGWKRTK